MIPLNIWGFNLKIARQKRPLKLWNYSKKYQQLSRPHTERSFRRIKAYVSTIRKNGLLVMDFIIAVLKGEKLTILWIRAREMCTSLISGSHVPLRCRRLIPIISMAEYGRQLLPHSIFLINSLTSYLSTSLLAAYTFLFGCIFRSTISFFIFASSKW